MVQQQKKRDGPVRCVHVCEERPAAEHRKSAEPEVVHGSGCENLAYVGTALRILNVSEREALYAL